MIWVTYYRRIITKIIKRIIGFNRRKRNHYKANRIIRFYIEESTRRNQGFNTASDLSSEISRVFDINLSPGYVRRIRRGFSESYKWSKGRLVDSNASWFSELDLIFFLFCLIPKTWSIEGLDKLQNWLICTNCRD